MIQVAPSGEILALERGHIVSLLRLVLDLINILHLVSKFYLSHT